MVRAWFTRTRSRWLLMAIAALAANVRTIAADAQQPTPPPIPVPPQSPVPAYRAPTIALVQPANGSAVPLDRPVVVFRFTQGEVADPVDARSFAVAVDGQDRTSLFQVSASEAWGPIADGARSVEPGVHQVTARICSTRGACTAVAATVRVVPDAAAAASNSAAPAKRRSRLIDLVLQVARKVLAP